MMSKKKEKGNKINLFWQGHAQLLDIKWPSLVVFTVGLIMAINQKEEVDGLQGKKEEVLLLVVKIKRKPRGGCRRKTYC